MNKVRLFKVNTNTEIRNYYQSLLLTVTLNTLRKSVDCFYWWLWKVTIFRDYFYSIPMLWKWKTINKVTIMEIVLEGSNNVDLYEAWLKNLSSFKLWYNQKVFIITHQFILFRFHLIFMEIFNFYYVSVRAIRNTLWKCSHCIDFTYNRRIEIFLEHRHLEIFLKLFTNENEVLNKVYA